MCNGGVLSRNYDGSTVLVADMLLESTPPRATHTLRLHLPKRLTITHAPGGASIGSQPEIVPVFRVAARITASAEELYETHEPHGLEFDQEPTDLSVFLNEPKAPMHLSRTPLPETTLTQQRRPSLKNKMALLNPFRHSKVLEPSLGVSTGGVALGAAAGRRDTAAVTGAPTAERVVLKVRARAGTDSTTGSKVAR